MKLLTIKIFSHTFLLSFLISAPVISYAVPTYECVRPAKAGGWHKTRKPRGNWGPQHNTRRWNYDAVRGKDIYRHKRGKRTVGTRCKKGGFKSYNFGQHKIDFIGNQDWCAVYKQGRPRSVTRPRCSSGYSLSPDKKICVRPGRTGYWKKIRKPRGNWGPQHNTRRWNYDAVRGKDIYRHKRGKRTVGTRCKKGGIKSYNFGQHKIDLVGNQDWCAKWQSPISAHTKRASCPSGYTLQPTSRAGGIVVPRPRASTVKPKRVR